jgi:hypothetical protein
MSFYLKNVCLATEKTPAGEKMNIGIICCKYKILYVKQ